MIPRFVGVFTGKRGIPRRYRGGDVRHARARCARRSIAQTVGQFEDSPDVPRDEDVESMIGKFGAPDAPEPVFEVDQPIAEGDAVIVECPQLVRNCPQLEHFVVDGALLSTQLLCSHLVHDLILALFERMF